MAGGKPFPGRSTRLPSRRRVVSTPRGLKRMPTPRPSRPCIGGLGSSPFASGHPRARGHHPRHTTQGPRFARPWMAAADNFSSGLGCGRVVGVCRFQSAGSRLRRLLLFFSPLPAYHLDRNEGTTRGVHATFMRSRYTSITYRDDPAEDSCAILRNRPTPGKPQAVERVRASRRPNHNGEGFHPCSLFLVASPNCTPDSRLLSCRPDLQPSEASTDTPGSALADGGQRKRTSTWLTTVRRRGTAERTGQVAPLWVGRR
jgi:hypothetical protein